MTPEDESSDPETPVRATDAELFDSALDVRTGDDGALDNPNSDTWRHHGLSLAPQQAQG
jgi:hypothetical protein